MEKYFNIAGPCIPGEHYMLPALDRLPEIRRMIYQYFTQHETVDAALVGNEAVLGSWRFVPEKTVGPLMEKDMDLIFCQVS